VSFITLLLPRSSVKAVDIVHCLFIAGGLRSGISESTKGFHIVRVGIKGRLSKGGHKSRGNGCVARAGAWMNIVELGDGPGGLK